MYIVAYLFTFSFKGNIISCATNNQIVLYLFKKKQTSIYAHHFTAQFAQKFFHNTICAQWYNNRTNYYNTPHI